MKIPAPYLLLIFVFLLACASDDGEYIEDPTENDPEIESPVLLDLESVPYETLSAYNFFEGEMAELKPVYGVLPYTLATPLFTDYAKKKRFVWMPKNKQATFVSDDAIFNFPTGTVLIKNFYYDNVLPENTTRVLETRLLIRTEEEWFFAEYIWNEEQTEATLDMNGAFVPVEWNQNGETKSVNYRIPSQAECMTCHKKSATVVPIGPKPQNINTIFSYDDEVKNQMKKWEDMGYLEGGYPSDIQTTINWEDTSEPLENRVRSYFDTNCAHCHIPDGHCDYRPIRFAFSATEDPTNMGVCVEPEQDISNMVDGNPTHIIYPGDVEKSALFYRMNTTEETIKMPLIGRSLIHEEGVALVEDWILSLEPSNCE